MFIYPYVAAARKNQRTPCERPGLRAPGVLVKITSMSVAWGKVPRIAVVVAIAIGCAFGLAQFTLPGIAAQSVRHKLDHYGTVRDVRVSADPAIELLWGDAQSTTITAEDLSMSFAQAAGLLSSLDGFDRLDMTVRTFALGPLTMQQATIRKRAGNVEVEGEVGESALQGGLPRGVEAHLLPGNGDEVEVMLRASLLGVTVSVPASITAREGKLVIQPRGAFGFPPLTLFSDPRMLIRGFKMSPIEAGAYRLKIVTTMR
jgi:hypothetical protein